MIYSENFYIGCGFVALMIIGIIVDYKAVARAKKVHHVTLHPSRYVTQDLGLAAYLQLRGARLHGCLRYNDNRFVQLMFTHKDIAKFIQEYYTDQPIKFAPRAFMQMRTDFKRMDPIDYDGQIKNADEHL